MNTFQDGLKAWMDLYRYRACPGSYLKYAFSINKAKYYNQIGESSWQSLHYLIFIINFVVILQCTAFQWWRHSNREFSNYAQFHRGRMSSPAQVIIIQHNTRMGTRATSMHFLSLSGVPDFFDRNKILSGGDLSHYQVPHCIRVFFYFVWFVFIHHNFILNYVLIVTFWIFTYHKIWILLIIFCFIWNYWIIYFLTCLEVFWSVVS